MSTDSSGFCLGFNAEFHPSCESDVEQCKTMSMTMPRHENQVKFDDPQKNHVNRSSHKIKVIFGPHTKTSLFRYPH